MLHTVARGGSLVEKPQDAEITFGLRGEVTPYDLDVIMTEYL